MPAIEISLDPLLAWWQAVTTYAAARWAPSLVTLLVSLILYLVGGRILRSLQLRFASRTATDLDDQLIATIRKAFRLTVVAWMLAQMTGTWIPVLGEASPAGDWHPYENQPGDWVWGVWIVAMFILLSRFVRQLMRTFESKMIALTSKQALDETALPMINRFIQFTVVAIGILVAMTQLGIQVAPLLAGAGVVGLALSLAAKDTLSNLIAGVLLIMDRPFQVGDRIELWNAPRETGTWGDVIEIGLRATKIRNPDNLVVVVPNNEIMRRDIINYTMTGDDIRLRIPVSVAYDSDIDRAKALLKEAALEVEGVKLDPEPFVIVRSFGPSEVNLQLRVWIHEARDRRRIGDEVTEKALIKYAREGVEIPYPRRDLHIRTLDGLSLKPGTPDPGQSLQTQRDPE